MNQYGAGNFDQNKTRKTNIDGGRAYESFPHGVSYIGDQDNAFKNAPTGKSDSDLNHIFLAARK